MKYYFNIALFIFITGLSHGQQITLKQYRGELNIKLEVIDEKRLEKGCLAG